MSMTLILRRNVGLLTLVVTIAALLAPSRRAEAIPPQPQTPEEILAECLMQIDAEVTRGLEGITDRTDEAIGQIENLRSAGAEAKKITKAARRGSKAVVGAARGALVRINRITGSCMFRMRRIGADRDLNAELLDARAAAIEALRSATDEGSARIEAAVTGDTDEPADSPL